MMTEVVVGMMGFIIYNDIYGGIMDWMDWGLWVIVVLDIQGPRLSPVTKQAWPFQMKGKKSSKPRVKNGKHLQKG